MRQPCRNPLARARNRGQCGDLLAVRSDAAARVASLPGTFRRIARRACIRCRRCATNYLASRPEGDPQRLGCVGLSLGGYRSFLLAALDPRIKVAVDVGWMTSFGSQIKRHVVHTVGLTFHIAGLYRYLDLPDLAALVAPRSLLVINGSRDGLFSPDGVRAAFAKIGACFQKAGAAERQRCRLYDAPHQFNVQMQDEAFAWLARTLRG